MKTYRVLALACSIVSLGCQELFADDSPSPCAAQPSGAAGSSGAVEPCPAGYECAAPPTQTVTYCLVKGGALPAPPACADQAACDATLPGGVCVDTPIGKVCGRECTR